jgi:DNA-binding NarL/FixJ family response regulator
MTNVLIADDHAAVRAGLRQLLVDNDDSAVVGEATTGAETLRRLREHRWDLLVLDINMPDRGGIDILRHIRSSNPEVRVLMLSGFPEKQFAAMALKAGASGYLEKDQAGEELLRAVAVVLGGHRYVGPRLAEQLAEDLNAPAEVPAHSRLSEREFQIFCKLAAGRRPSEIARELFISLKTVSTYRARVLEKMGFHTNADLTTYALRSGLIQ